MQPRRIARELALLSASQMPNNPEKLSQQELQSFIFAAVRTLVGEVRDTLETASLELKRSSERLLDSKVRSVDTQSTQAMLSEAIDLAQVAINRLGTAVDLPELAQVASQTDVRDYALRIIQTLNDRRSEIDEILEASLVEWQLHRVAQIDRNILKIAVAEIHYLEVPERVAINEAVELAKRYSTEDGHRFVNGVLRRVSRQLAGQPET
ncbi:MAG: transcription antitermination protein NusB [Acaryochloridaceae cyanobacterium RU_4_10]|nr:transcription antitermination protein NusB [Acaryochloridaceae cyanobacterium RU_4_10]